MQQSRLQHLPVTSLLFALVAYGGWLLIILTWLFWDWSGMATIGLAYLVFVAPVLMGYVAWRLYGQRKQSQIHLMLFFACAFYPVLPVVILVLGKILNS